jgi:hypothetical protein
MSLSSLLYVSHSRIPDEVADSSVEQMVAAALIRNRNLGVTGALLFTGKHFAQVIEGPPREIDLLWGDIRRDIRHEKWVVLEQTAIQQRRFSDWNLAFFGPSHLVSRQVERLSRDPAQVQHRRSAAWLNELFQEACGRGASAAPDADR